MLEKPKIEIIDNFLEEDLSVYIRQVCLFRLPHYFGHGVYPEKNIYSYATNIEKNDDTFLFNYLKYKINVITNFEYNNGRIYMNVQYPKMEGELHTDDGDRTAIYMASDTVEKGSEFVYRMGSKIVKVPFVRNRLILIDAKLWHRGNAPKEPKPRITLAFKLHRR